MQKIFETLIDSYVDNKVGIAENFLNESLAANLKDNLYLLYAQEAMKMQEQEMKYLFFRINL